VDRHRVLDLALALLDEDRTTISRDFVEKFEAGGYFSVTRYLSSPTEADVLMDTGTVDAFIFGNLESNSITAGQGAGLIKDIPTCRELIERIAGETDWVMKRLNAICQT